MVLGIADNHDTTSAGFDFVALRDAFGSVVGALGLEIRADFADDGADVFLGKDDNSIDVGEGGENFRAFGFRHDRTAFAFQCANRGVGIHSDDEFTSKGACGAEVADVADVEDVEAAVGESDAISGIAPGGDTTGEFSAGKNLRME